MTSDPHNLDEHGPIEMPRPTVWPMVVALGLAFALAGVATHLAILVVGAAILLFGVAGWVVQMAPGQGHVHEERAEPGRRPQRQGPRQRLQGQRR